MESPTDDPKACSPRRIRMDDVSSDFTVLWDGGPQWNLESEEKYHRAGDTKAADRALLICYENELQFPPWLKEELVRRSRERVHPLKDKVRRVTGRLAGDFPEKIRNRLNHLLVYNAVEAARARKMKGDDAFVLAGKMLRLLPDPPLRYKFDSIRKIHNEIKNSITPAEAVLLDDGGFCAYDADDVLKMLERK